MKKIVGILVSLMLVLGICSCGNIAQSEKTGGILAAAKQVKQIQEKEAAGMEKETSEMIVSVSKLEQEETVGKKTLVVYFSATGTTKALAEYVAEITDADIYEIVPKQPYTEADLEYYTNSRADQEQNNSDARPEISGNVENMENYDIVILGYPIWHGQAPKIISTFLESYDLSGKCIVPFCTSHSSGIGSSADNLYSLCVDTVIWKEGRRFAKGTGKDEVKSWLNEVLEN